MKILAFGAQIISAGLTAEKTGIGICLDKHSSLLAKLHIHCVCIFTAELRQHIAGGLDVYKRQEKTLSSRKKKKQQPEKEKAAQGLTPCAAERIECISLFEQFVFHPEICLLYTSRCV